MKFSFQTYVLLTVLFVSLSSILSILNLDNITGKSSTSMPCLSSDTKGTASVGSECCAEEYCIPPDPNTHIGCSEEYTCEPGLTCRFAPGWTFNGVCEVKPVQIPIPPSTSSPNLGELIINSIPVQQTQVIEGSQDVLLATYSLNFTGSQNAQYPVINFTEFSFEFSGGIDLNTVRILIDGNYYAGLLSNIPSIGGKYKFDLYPHIIYFGIGQTRYIDVIADIPLLPSGVQSLQYTTKISNILDPRFTTTSIQMSNSINIIKSFQQSATTQPSTWLSNTTQPLPQSYQTQQGTTQQSSSQQGTSQASPQTTTQNQSGSTTQQSSGQQSTSQTQQGAVQQISQPSPTQQYSSIYLPLRQQYINNLLNKYKWKSNIPINNLQNKISKIYEAVSGETITIKINSTVNKKIIEVKAVSDLGFIKRFSAVSNDEDGIFELKITPYILED